LFYSQFCFFEVPLFKNVIKVYDELDTSRLHSVLNELAELQVLTINIEVLHLELVRILGVFDFICKSRLLYLVHFKLLVV